MNRANNAFSLPELMIALAIMATILAAILGSLSSVQDYIKLSDAQDDLANEGRRTILQIETDLSQSGWLFPSGDPPATMTGATGDRQSGRYYPYIQVQATDGSAAGTGLGSALGEQFPHHTRTQTLVALAVPDGLPGQPGDATRLFDLTSIDDLRAWRTSFYARSQEIIFVRARQGTTQGSDAFIFFDRSNSDAWSLGPTSVAACGKNPHEALSMLKMSEWCRAIEVPIADRTAQGIAGSGDEDGYYRVRNGRKVYDVVLDSAFLDTLDSDLPMRMQWETTESLDVSTINTPADCRTTDVNYVNIIDGLPLTSILREYSYCVVPSRAGLGRLVRAYKKRFGTTMPTVVSSFPDIGSCIAAAKDPAPDNTTAAMYYGMVVDKVLSDNVMRIVFDTVRTARPADSGDATTLGPASAALIKQDALDVNTVRVRLFLAARTSGDRLAHSLLETTVTMRARSGVVEVAADRKTLTPPTPLDFLPR